MANFVFTGGTLQADVVAFDLVNDGGTLLAGHEYGGRHRHDEHRWEI